jgi:two-component system, chemotaxis family, CheB/CheR fusion protein
MPSLVQATHKDLGLPLITIGASTGGLEALTQFLHSLPETSLSQAFVFIQHLEPHQKSLLVEIVSKRTRLKVQEATEGALLEAGNLYIIPAGQYLSLSNNTLHLSPPPVEHSVRLPIDYWLASVAQVYKGPKAVLIMTGSGDDGSDSLCAFKASGGTIIAQAPADCEAPDMPKAAIATGHVDQILGLDEMWAQLQGLDKSPKLADTALTEPPIDNPNKSENISPAELKQCLSIMLAKTGYDFTPYKSGTLQRRLWRRIGLSTIQPRDVPTYLKWLQTDAHEAQSLASDLLIHVTQFFRDPETFAYVQTEILPELLVAHGVADRQNKPLRLWVCGCSTGEEAYSLAMLCLEAIEAHSQRTTSQPISLQILASDIDAASVAFAREGRYPHTIEDKVSSKRLEQFFVKDEHFYRVTQSVRDCIIFCVHDALRDPPFSSLDMVSCRNLLIYLNPQAQTQLLGQLHFALKTQGLLLLGAGETNAAAETLFAKLGPDHRLYKKIEKPALSSGLSTGLAVVTGPQLNRPLDLDKLPQPRSKAKARAEAFSAFCQQAMTEETAVACVIINDKNECLFSQGDLKPYLSFQGGPTSLDILSMLATDIRPQVRLRLKQSRSQTVTPSADSGRATGLRFKLLAFAFDGETYGWLGFIESPSKDTTRPKDTINPKAMPNHAEPVASLEAQLAAVRAELKAALENFDAASQEHRVSVDETLSINEEYQSTNEELLTSKEELQSSNEELTALNTQLQDSLLTQRSLANDLKNVLYSTDMATLFLDKDLKIRFFTPATKALFNILPGDVGRPLSDLNALAMDIHLGRDAKQIFLKSQALEAELKTAENQWFMRKILPYRGKDNEIEGVVVTFNNITERKSITEALEKATLSADFANKAKSRFLAAASHDLRQPLQSLALVQGQLAKIAESKDAQKLVARLEVILEAMSLMLNSLLDINQFETGMVKATKISFCVEDLLNRLRDEFTYYAQARHLKFKVVASQLTIFSDPVLLEQMLRNFLSNAFKYTRTGTIVLGCRRKHDHMSFEVWDSGIGISARDLTTIFDEYSQVDNPARQRKLGLGLGLSIVQSLGKLLGHRVSVRSNLGQGSVFAIVVEAEKYQTEQKLRAFKTSLKLELGPVQAIAKASALAANASLKPHIFIIEDDAELCELLEITLNDQGYSVKSAPDGLAALALLRESAFIPDLILADFNLPKGMNGLEAIGKIREQQASDMPALILPAIILSGDISTVVMRQIKAENCTHLSKPVKPETLISHIKSGLLANLPKTVQTTGAIKANADMSIYIIDDDALIRDSLADVFEAEGMRVFGFASAEDFLVHKLKSGSAVILIDAYLPGVDGLELMRILRDRGHVLPMIMITGNSDVGMAVKAMKAGALDFLEKPISYKDLNTSVLQALALAGDAQMQSENRDEAISLISRLTKRQFEVMERVLKGEPSKNIAADLHISQRTVENHRAAIMTKTGMKSLPALARLSLAAL